MNKLVIVDLDRTLFNSDKFYIDICKALERAGKLDPRQLAEAVSLMSDPEATPYITDLVKRFSVDEAGIEKILSQYLKPDAYLYPDVKGFLGSLKENTVVILTTGIPRYQELKFTFSPSLAGLEHRIISQRNKGEYIKARLAYGSRGVRIRGMAAGQWFSELYLVDDRNYNLNALAGMKRATLFHIRRPTEKLADSQVARGVHTITNLKEVK